MKTSSKACLLIIFLQLINVISAQEVMKRVPQGFLGMRGKKDYEILEENEHIYKRNPKFFVGVKGKKYVVDFDDNLYNKRAPMGFVGMRGKKAYDSIESSYPFSNGYLPKSASLIGQIDYAPNDDALQEQSTYPFLNQFINNYLNELKTHEEQSEPNSVAANVDIQTNEANEPDLSQITNEVEKRAANFNQFYGVRGKKLMQPKRPFDVSIRGKFIGVRGKKDLQNTHAKEIRVFLDNNGPWPKRKGQMSGFFGMRGKKYTDDPSIEQQYLN